MVPKWDRRRFFIDRIRGSRVESSEDRAIKTSLLKLRQVSMRSTEQALAYQEEWRVAAVVSTMKSCRLSANRLARVTIRMYTVGK